MSGWIFGLRDTVASEWTWEAARRARESTEPTWAADMRAAWDASADEPFDFAEYAELQRELGFLRLQFEEEKASGCYHTAGLQGLEVAKLPDGSYEFTGVASTIGNADRMRRVMLPGAFNFPPKKVPLLAYHDERRPIGTSTLTPDGRGRLLHTSRLANVPEAADFRELIKAGAIPATSIGWISNDKWHGWRTLERAQPLLAKLAAELGAPQSEDITYFATAEIVENSLVPLPANPLALIQAASLFGDPHGFDGGRL